MEAPKMNRSIRRGVAARMRKGEPMQTALMNVLAQRGLLPSGKNVKRHAGV